MKYYLHLEVFEHDVLMQRYWMPDTIALRKRANRINRDRRAIQRGIEARLVEYPKRMESIDKYEEELG